MALGHEEFKTALLEVGKKVVARRVLEGQADARARELLWEGRLAKCLDWLNKTGADAARDAKSAEWKVAVCTYMGEATGCKVP